MMEFWGITDRGKVRRDNQDAYYISESEPRVLLVCDGMGGAKGGAVASDLAIKTFRTASGGSLRAGMQPGEIAAALQGAVRTANTAVYELSLADEHLSGMGTTLVGAAVNGDVAVVVNVGDSRCYKLHNGGIRQVTKDHSLVENMIDRGEITRAESYSHPNRNLITRAVGTMAEVESDVFTERLTDGDSLLLCSDGLSNVVTEHEMLEKAVSESPESAAKALLELALNRGAPDNVTVVILRK
ncbi:MAG: Stp1/IreP family PP2C-type Ser/Thr phosphatase [Oscillospiraceae bacterium]|nr:Stp1/IreP family PP2C-type Ser/Thr phosphatase [Oscillospiraceae bacterium]